MTAVALVGLPGAPGVTTTALALLRAWPVQDRRLLLAECDPDGGAILPGAFQGRVAADRGLANLAVSRAQELVSSFWTQLIFVDDGRDSKDRRRLLLPGLADPSQAAQLRGVWRQLAELLVRIDEHQHDVLIDLGRSGAFGPSQELAARADAVVLVVRGTMRSIHAARSRVATLRRILDADGARGSSGLGVLLVKQGPYGRQEVQKALGVPVVTAMPYRPEEASVLSDGTPEDRRFPHGELMRTARQAVIDLRGFGESRRVRGPSGHRPVVSDPRQAVARHAG
ncbi:hypothetical protein ACWD01_33450 [Streptomyces sp. NPDC002835]